MSFPVGGPSSTDAGFLHVQGQTFTCAATAPSPRFLVHLTLAGAADKGLTAVLGTSLHQSNCMALDHLSWD